MTCEYCDGNVVSQTGVCRRCKGVNDMNDPLADPLFEKPWKLLLDAGGATSRVCGSRRAITSASAPTSDVGLTTRGPRAVIRGKDDRRRLRQDIFHR
jgi:hypothetical protein